MTSSPSALMHQHFIGPRDPGGLNPCGIELTGEDPVGVPPPHLSPVGLPDHKKVLPPTPTRRMMLQTDPVVALLVGTPPPPPQAPPPSRKKKTTSPRKQSRLAPQMPLDEGKLGGPPSSVVISPSSKSSSIVEERLRKARAIYQSDSLVLDPPTGETQVGRRLSSSTPKFSGDSENLYPVQPQQQKQIPTSPMSAATEPRSNHNSGQSSSGPLTQTDSNGDMSRAAGVRQSPSVSAGKTSPRIPETVSREVITMRRQRSKTPEPKKPQKLYPEMPRAKTPDPRPKTPVGPKTSLGRPKTPVARPKTPVARPKTPDQRPKTPDLIRVSTDNSSVTKDRKQKTSFFRKIFGKKKIRLTDEQDSRTVVSDKSGKRSQGQDSDSSANPSMPAILTESDDVYEGELSEMDDNRRTSDAFLSHDEVSTLTAPTVHENRLRRQDPVEENDHISDPLGHYWNKLSTSSTSTDKSQNASVDPFVTHFFGEPNGSLPSSSKKMDLRVETEPVHEDPFGMSPVSSSKKTVKQNPKRYSYQDPSPRGFQTPSFNEFPYKDPKGESPLHKHERGPSELRDGALYAPDPPLYFKDGNHSDVSDYDEEKKSDDVYSLRKFVPPPPPSPLLNSKNVLRIPLSQSVGRSGSQTSMTQCSDNELIQSKNSPLLPTVSNRPKTPGSPAYEIPAKSLLDAEDISTTDEDSTIVSRSASENIRRAITPSMSGLVDSDEALAEVEAEMKREREAELEAEAQRKREEAETEELQQTQTELFQEPIHTGEVDNGSRKVSDRNSFSISAAARMNARAVKYLLALNGEPSPRRSWRRPDLSDDEFSPANTKGAQLSGTYNHERKHESDPNTAGEDNGRLFAAYSEKFKGRRRQLKHVESVGFTEPSPRSASASFVLESRPLQTKSMPKEERGPLQRNIEISSLAFAVGVSVLRQYRQDLIERGLAERVVAVRKPKVPVVKSYFDSTEEPEPRDPIQRAGRRLLSKAAIPVQSAVRRYLAQREAVDRMWGLIEIQSYMRRWRAEVSLIAYRRSAIAIQRVFRGSRIRSALVERHFAAIQIQRIARGYIAAAHTYDEVYMIILIQALARGNIVREELARQKAAREQEAAVKLQSWWRAHFISTVFQFLVVDVIIAQSIVRRWLACRKRSDLYEAKRHMSSVMIQAVWRGYKAYETRMRYVSAVKVQSAWRGHIAYQARMRYVCAVKIQSAWRGHMAYEAWMRYVSAVKIQSAWRGYCVYETIRQFISAVRIQSVWRGFRAYRNVKELSSALRIQAAWRTYCLEKATRRNCAAITIQKVWRGFQGYTDYIFSLVDILIVQRSVRRWLAVRLVNDMRQERAALIIQTSWRRHCAQMQMLFDLVHIIVIQSIARRYLARNNAMQIRYDNYAAVKIQAAWRGFWQYSHYIIMQYEVLRLQAIVRGRFARKKLVLKLGCCIMIQSAARRFLAVSTLKRLKLTNALVQSSAQALRETIACKRIQFWWRIVLECRKEKAAALVIERFFLMVKAEVEAEIRRVEEKKNSKREQRRRKQKDAEDKLLEKVWLNTVDESHVDVFAFSPCESFGSRSFGGTPTIRQSPSMKSMNSRNRSVTRGVSHRASSPPMNLVMRHEKEERRERRTLPPSSAELLSPSFSEVSGITAHTVSRNARYSRSEISEELSVGDSYPATDFRAYKEKKSSAEKYLKLYGIRPAPSHGARVHHFFADDLESTTSSVYGSSRYSVPNSENNVVKSVHGANAKSSAVSSPFTPSSSLDKSMRTVRAESPRAKSSQQVALESPRHGKILVMNPYPDYPNSNRELKESLELDYDGEQYGLI